MTPYPLSRISIRSYGFVKHLIKEHSVTVLALCTGKREKNEISITGFESVTLLKDS
jgi:hypothetical protein